MHVLLVEDDADSRMLLSRYIESGGHTVDECSDSPSALAHFANTEYDVVVTDYQLPSMDGSQLASTLLAQVPGLRVLLVTAHPIDGLASSCYRVGVERILNKPIRRAALLGALKTAPELYLGVDSPALRSELEGHCSALGVDYCVIPSRCVGGPLPKGIPQLTDRRIEARGDVVRIGNEGQPHERLLRPPLSPEDLEHLLPERAAADFSSTVANLDPDARDLLPGYISNRKREMGELTAHL
ncbi:MAG: response regulator, partial [Myxococcota bacterium]